MINGQGYNQLQQSPPQPTRSLDSLTIRLAESLKRVNDLRDRARSIADDVFGGGLVGTTATYVGGSQLGGPISGGSFGVSGTLTTNVPRGRTQTLDQQADELERLLTSLAVEIDRLTCL